MEEHQQKSNNNSGYDEKFWKIWANPVAVIVGSLVISLTLLYNGGQLSTPRSLTNNNQGGSVPIQTAGGDSGTATVTERKNAPMIGGQSAKVTVVEFGDFQCPYCKQFFDQTFKEIKTNYIDTGKIKYIFRHLPLPFHQNAQIAAVAAECANLQGKFWQYHDTLYTKGSGDGTGLASADLKKYAVDLGLNTDSFNRCLDSNATLDTVKSDAAEATKDGVTGTPTFVINGKKIVGALPYSNFESALNEALK